MRRNAILLALLASASIRCAEGDSLMDAGPPDTGIADAGALDSGVETQIPTPPMTIAAEWPDTEPNDTPEQAVPVGVIEEAVWMGFSMPLNAINDDDDVDFYVFRTPDAEGLMRLTEVSFIVCWQGGLDLVDLALYRVEEGRIAETVREAATQSPNCEDLMAGMQPSELLSPESIYLLEVRAAPGLMLGGSPGLYEA
ncbi:MAG: hypothetical protein KC621_23215 [Myxococcales bacterium]|nr:hypothetical protein [Myxococcales bacterium]MCB9648419.1 hypothetical protein [Deltaproteobacteria bacterium]